MNMPMSLRGVSGIPGTGKRQNLSCTDSSLGRAGRFVSRPTTVLPATPHRSRGFTLIELFVVLLIVGVLVSYALPGFNNLIKEARLDSGADKITTTINTARN